MWEEVRPRIAISRTPPPTRPTNDVLKTTPGTPEHGRFTTARAEDPRVEIEGVPDRPRTADPPKQNENEWHNLDSSSHPWRQGPHSFNKFLGIVSEPASPKVGEAADHDDTARREAHQGHQKLCKEVAKDSGKFSEGSVLYSDYDNTVAIDGWKNRRKGLVR